MARYEPGDGTVKAEKPRLRMGPIHTRAGRDELLEQISDGVAKGGEVLVGGGTAGREKGWFLEPAVVAEPGEDSRLVREEVFGPVLPVFRYSDFADAIRRANDTPYGLGSSIWTHDVRKIHRAAQEIEAGMTWVNQIHYGYDELPFGGLKESALGAKELGRRPGPDGTVAHGLLTISGSMVMIESEGITEEVREWRTDIVATIARELGLENVMFEAADPEVFAWYVKNYGPDVNLFVDHSQIVQLECLRAGIWGTADLWGKVVTYKG